MEKLHPKTLILEDIGPNRRECRESYPLDGQRRAAYILLSRLQYRAIRVISVFSHLVIILNSRLNYSHGLILGSHFVPGAIQSSNPRMEPKIVYKCSYAVRQAIRLCATITVNRTYSAPRAVEIASTGGGWRRVIHFRWRCRNIQCRKESST